MLKEETINRSASENSRHGILSLREKKTKKVFVYLCLVDTINVDAEERIGEPRVRQASRVREVEVDDEDGEERKEDVEAQFAEA